MGPPTAWMRFRHTFGRALRETGQAMDRLGIRTQELFLQDRRYGDDDPFIYDDFMSRHRQQMPLLKYGRPLISPDVAYLAPCSTMIGSVRIGAGSSVWYKAVLRADECSNGSSFAKSPEEEAKVWELDVNRFTDYRIKDGDKIGGGIFIGDNTNVQDGAIITSRVGHTIIGDGVTIGHLAQIHSAKIEDHCLIGMGSVIQEGCEIESESFIAAGAVLPAKTVVKAGELWAGVPAKKLRDLTAEQREKLHYQADEYVKVAKNQSGVMELGGNMPGDWATKLSLSLGKQPAIEDPSQSDDPVVAIGDGSSSVSLPIPKRDPQTRRRAGSLTRLTGRRTRSPRKPKSLQK
ncbi:Gamma carbonic anhydrase [Seminavis robusta]|uniref:Gamma carbonic anhydrase n=1 Tax=Seminavis robusta TaxID=568900 RepID=A0A9N8D9P1_9STRA|nr:Gamma carbonic anhydrase [Seminavis robusta]|eukprot:Sro49_g028820.1 Gamma carbonic anhydrase (347) ;mRNA; r:127720-128856